MTRIRQFFARIPVPVVAALLVVGGALVPVHELTLAHTRATGQAEWPQWLAYLTVKWYWAFLPAAALALWARRSSFQGVLGRVGGWLNLVGGPLQYAILLTGALVAGVVGRDEMPVAVMSVELLSYLIVPGMVLAGIAMLRDREVPRWQGALVVVLPVAAWLPFGALAVGLVLGGLLVTKGRNARPVLDSPAPFPAR